jgi:hypothetical protein
MLGTSMVVVCELRHDSLLTSTSILVPGVSYCLLLLQLEFQCSDYLIALPFALRQQNDTQVGFTAH